MTNKSFYKVSDYTRLPFKDKWVYHCEEFVPHQNTLVASYEAEDDGATVNVYVEAWPEVFHTLQVTTENKKYSIEFGGEQSALAAQVAEAISQGMMTVDQFVKSTVESMEHAP